MRLCKLKIVWDDGIWVAEADDDDFGLVLESDSFDALVERVKIAVKDTLEVDLKYTGEVRFVIQAEREDKIMALAG
ncbi:MAG: DUF1902 domain-containing protein [Defluviitaleaceae bacterium]|nr:DUF1902 domain-containing protein [Defluviitaleaceae bacterium]